MSRREHAGKGLASLAGAACCLVIASELWEDLTRGKRHFALPRPLKAAALVVFTLFAVLEAAKVRGRIEEVLNGTNR